MSVPTYATVTAAVRALLDDLAVAGGAIYDDTFLEPFVQVAQNTLVAQLAAGSVQQMLFRSELLIPATTTFLSYSFDATPSVPSLPSALIIPDQLWEARAGTNLLSPNVFTFVPTPWSGSDGFGNPPTVTTGQTDPNGGTTATRWAWPGGGPSAWASQTSSTLIPLGDYNTFSIWMKAAAPATVTVKSPFTGGVDQTISLTTSWQKFNISFGPRTEQTPVYHKVWFEFGTSAVTVYLWDVELGTDLIGNEEFFPMTGPTEIPRTPATDRLQYWNWYADKLWFHAATVDRIARIDWWGDLNAVSSAAPSSRIMIINGGNALACLVASMAARGRQQHAIADRLATFNMNGSIGGQAGVEINAIINAETKAQQSEPSRRRPYFGRDRYSGADYWIRGRY